MTATYNVVKRFHATLVSVDDSIYKEIYFQLNIEKPFCNINEKADPDININGFCNLTGKSGTYKALMDNQLLFNCDINEVGMVGNFSDVHL